MCPKQPENVVKGRIFGRNQARLTGNRCGRSGRGGWGRGTGGSWRRGAGDQVLRRHLQRCRRAVIRLQLKSAFARVVAVVAAVMLDGQIASSPDRLDMQPGQAGPKRHLIAIVQARRSFCGPFNSKNELLLYFCDRPI